MKKYLDRVLERTSKTKEAFTIMQVGFPVAVVFDWRDFVTLEQRRTRLTTIMDAVEHRPRVGHVLGLLQNDAFQKLLCACKHVQRKKEQVVFLKARLFDEQQELTMQESKLATLEKQFRERSQIAG